MKKLFLLLLLIPVLASAQKTTGTNYTYIAQRYEWIAGIFKGLGLPAGAGPADFYAGQERRAGAVYYDSVGVDSGLYVYSGLAWNKQGSDYTDADARAALSLTTTGTSGVATYNSGTGVFNIPNYSDGGFFSPNQTSTGNTLHDLNGNTFSINSGVANRLTLSPSTWTLRSQSLLNYIYLTDGIAGAYTEDSPASSTFNIYPNGSFIFGGSTIDAGADENVVQFNAGSLSPRPLHELLIRNTVGKINLQSLDTLEVNDFQYLLGAGLDTLATLRDIRDGSSGGLSGSIADDQVAFGNGTSITGSNNFTWSGNSLLLQPGADTVGVIRINNAAGTKVVHIGSNPIASSVGSLWFGNVAPSATNYSIQGTFNETNVNNPTAVKLRISNLDALIVNSAREVQIGSTSDLGAFNLQNTGNFINTGFIALREQSAPSTPASGDAVIYPKTDGLWYGKDDAGVEKKLSNPTLTKNINLPLPTASENEFIFFTPVAITVTNTRAVLVGSASPSVTYNISFGTDRTSLTNVYTAGQTVTSTTTGTNASGVNDNTIPANSWVVLTTTAMSGTVTAINGSVQFTED